jgi:response regulator RpfG family c-di-GMP phosphodiesterase
VRPRGLDSACLPRAKEFALSEQGHGFSITASCGAAILHGSITTAEDALRVADRRLTDSEWAFVRQHTIIGQRIVSVAAPALAYFPRINSETVRWRRGLRP